MFTKQHFELIAETIKEIEPINKRIEFAEQWIKIFKQNNSRFKEDLFLKACDLKITFHINNPKGQIIKDQLTADEVLIFLNTKPKGIPLTIFRDVDGKNWNTEGFKAYHK